MRTDLRIPRDLRVHTWNVQGLGEIARGTVIGSELLKNLEQIGDFDFFMIQEHKLTADRIPFVNKRLRNVKAFWTPTDKEEDGIAKGGLAIFVGDKFADKIIDAGVDKKNAFMWLTVATEAGQMGIVNVYGAHSPAGHAKIWRRMVVALDSSSPSLCGGDWNFIERRKDKQGGICFAHKEEDIWTEVQDME